MSHLPSESDCVTLATATRLIGRRPSEVNAAVHSGRLPRVRTNGRLLVRVVDLQDLMKPEGWKRGPR